MSVGNFFKNLFGDLVDFFRKIPKELQEAIHIGVIVVEKLKAIMDSPIVDILTAIIPSDVDDAVKEKLREWLPKILLKLRLAQACGNLEDTDEIIACALNTLKDMDDEDRAAFLHIISVKLSQKVSHTKLSWSIGVYLSQWYYDHKYKPAVA